MSNILTVTEVLSQYLLGLAQNFVFLSLVQKFFSQVFYFINATLFNEILLVRELCTVDKAVEIKMHLASLENWIIEEGGMWLEVSLLRSAFLLPMNSTLSPIIRTPRCNWNPCIRSSRC